jgi:hypothetical protein
MRFSKQITTIVLTVVSAPLIVGPAWGQFRDDERFPGPGAALIAQAQPPPSAPAINPPAVAPAAQAKIENGVEVLTSGPVHEGFAGPLVLDPKPGVTVQKEPPRPVEELPPDQRPEGNDVEWIPGYWHWDDQRSDFIWVSGVWREIPQGRRWVVGYWGQAGDGWQRTSGFWAPAEEREVAYVEEPPPQTLEVGPNIEAPSENHFWVPGCWMYRDVRYVWRPGFWHVAYPDWSWTPSHWNWTPSGYVHTTGYWDYPFARRGVCFAPVYYHQPLYTYDDYYWSPSVCFGFGALSLHLFARPNYHHYYCGDYYGSHWRGHGFHIWSDFHRHRGHYDPHFVHSRWYHHHHRGDRHWERNLASRHQHFVNNVDARPARTFNEQIARRGRGLTPADAVVGQRLGDLSRDDKTPVKLVNLDKKTRDDVASGARRWRDFQRERATVEGSNRLPANRIVDATRKPGEGARPDRKSPDAAAAAAARGTRERPRFKLPESNLGVSKRPTVGAGAVAGGAPPTGDSARTRPDRGDRQPRPGPREGAADKLPTTRQPRVTPPDRPDIARPGVDRPNIDRPRADRPGPDRPNIDRPGDRPRVDRPQPKIDRSPAPDTRRPDPAPPRIEGSRRPRVETPPPSGGDRAPRRAPEASRDRPDRGRADQAGATIERSAPQRPPVERAAPQPRVERPAPPRVERPAPRVERPAPPRVERPAPRIERPAPRVERSAPPRVERPAPRIERPAPRVERPAPRVERPAPRVERPAPQRAPVQRAAPSRPPSRPQAAPRAAPSRPPSRPPAVQRAAPSRPAPQRAAPSRPAPSRAAPSRPAPSRAAPSRPAPSRSEGNKDRRNRR